MRHPFMRSIAGISLILLPLTSTQCAFYNEVTGRDQVISHPVKKISKAPERVQPPVVQEGIEESYQRGISAMEQGNYSQAIEAFLSVFSRNPGYGEVRKKLIETYRLNQKKEAEKGLATEVAEYVIGLGDVLNISVWQWPDLQMPNVIVRPDGKISFPLVGDIQAEGLTLTELDRILTEKLDAFIKNPEVSVSVTQFGGRKVIVLGSVGSQGVYAPTGRTSVLEVIALAGGFRQDAVTSSVILIRQQPERNLFYRLNLKTALRGGNMRDNIEVESNDIIFVPKRFITSVNEFVSQITPMLGGVLTANAVLKDYEIDVSGRE